MKQFRVIMSVAVLVASVTVLMNQLLVSQPIQIILETGQEVVTQDSGYFSMVQVLIMVTAAFLMGSTAIYLYFRSETDELLRAMGQKREYDRKYEAVVPLLSKDERMVFQELLDNKGEVLQNALVLRTGLSKVRMTRVLASLERKKLIVKERHGLTNRIRLK